MATKTYVPVTPGDIISTVQKFSNSEDESALFSITAEVSVNSGAVTHFNNGMATLRNREQGSAYFNGDANGSFFNINANGLKDDELQQAVKDIRSFMNEVKEYINK